MVEREVGSRGAHGTPQMVSQVVGPTMGLVGWVVVGVGGVSRGSGDVASEQALVKSCSVGWRRSSAGLPVRGQTAAARHSRHGVDIVATTVPTADRAGCRQAG